MAEMQFDSIELAEYPADLYASTVAATPIAGLDAWTGGHDEQFREVGFVSVAGVYSEGEVQGALDALIAFAVGPRPEGIELQFESAAKGHIESLSPEDRLDYVRKLMWFTKHDPRVQAVAYQPGLMEVVTRMLGAEPELFQDMALMKPPGIGREKPWHQDHAYFNLPAGTQVVGVWIALDEATADNGAMVFLPGGHKDGPQPHFQRRDWQICDTHVPSVGKVVAPLPRGGALIFDGLVPHGTPNNTSGLRRRALQFHYVAKGTPRTTTEERMELFGSEGRDVSC
ncbi:MAG: phytanoyl-CoA dioxygenase family protein [Armatimonadetes bacterium]|nr:phytanoyl-CoA dioxygenase family protein [Armatimonadota bacterium]